MELLMWRPWLADWPSEKRNRLSELKFRQWFKNEGEARLLDFAASTPFNLEDIQRGSEILGHFGIRV